MRTDFYARAIGSQNLFRAHVTGPADKARDDVGDSGEVVAAQDRQGRVVEVGVPIVKGEDHRPAGQATRTTQIGVEVVRRDRVITVACQPGHLDFDIGWVNEIVMPALTDTPVPVGVKESTIGACLPKVNEELSGTESGSGRWLADTAGAPLGPLTMNTATASKPTPKRATRPKAFEVISGLGSAGRPASHAGVSP